MAHIGCTSIKINELSYFRPKRKTLQRHCFAWSQLRPSVRESSAPVTPADPGQFSLSSHPFLSHLSHLPHLCVFPLFPNSVAAAGGSCSDQNRGNIQRNQFIVYPRKPLMCILMEIHEFWCDHQFIVYFLSQSSIKCDAIHLETWTLPSFSYIILASWK